jgi:predicted RNA-binding protein with PIN domain
MEMAKRMTNKLLIDGWNVCWKIPEIAANIPGNLPRARHLLNTKVQSYFQKRNVQYRIIYDGQPGQENYERSSGKGEIRFSNNPEKADHLVIKFLKNRSDARSWTVVTSDLPLSGKVKQFEASVITAEEFSAKMTSRQNSKSPSFKTSPNLSKQEIESWLTLFNQED